MKRCLEFLLRELAYLCASQEEYNDKNRGRTTVLEEKKNTNMKIHERTERRWQIQELNTNHVKSPFSQELAGVNVRGKLQPRAQEDQTPWTRDRGFLHLILAKRPRSDGTGAFWWFLFFPPSIAPARSLPNLYLLHIKKSAPFGDVRIIGAQFFSSSCISVGFFRNSPTLVFQE